MTDSVSSASKKAGLPPGALVHVGEAHEAPTRITVIDYSKEHMQEHTLQSIEELLQYQDTDTVTWVNIEGLRDVSIIESIGSQLSIHPLVLEDILNTHQRPKLEEYDEYLFIVLKALSVEVGEFDVTHEQVSLLIMKNLVLTFKERADELFTPLRLRLENAHGRFRSLGVDYLSYVILDTIVDQYFSVQDAMDETIELIEDELLASPSTATLVNIQLIRRELVFIRRSISPLRELLMSIQRSDSQLLQEKTLIYFRDVYDHSIRLIEAMESQRDLIAGMLDIYLSSISNRMNETMKVLTVFASIFIPLTFIVGIYGMNFEYMPELKWKWAYPTLWVGFIVIPVVLLRYFKKKKWL